MKCELLIVLWGLKRKKKINLQDNLFSWAETTCVSTRKELQVDAGLQAELIIVDNKEKYISLD